MDDSCRDKLPTDLCSTHAGPDAPTGGGGGGGGGGSGSGGSLGSSGQTFNAFKALRLFSSLNWRDFIFVSASKSLPFRSMDRVIQVF